MRSKTLVLLTLALLCLGCIGGPTVTLTAGDSGKSVQLRKGQTLAVVLVGEPAAGQDWKLTAPDPKILTGVGTPKSESIDPEKPVGSGVRTTWTFKAVSAGTGKITIAPHNRTHAARQLKVKTFEATVVVK